MLFVRSLIFSFSQIITTILFSLLGVLLLPVPFKWRYKVVSKWAKVNLWLLKVLCGIRFSVQGVEHIPEQPCIIMCKHQSAWETLALQVVFPQQVWVLKRELLWIPFFGWGLAALNPIAIDRGAGRKALNQVVEQGKSRLAAGSFIVIFPEGTRVPVGEMGRFGIGGAKLAVEAGANVVTVAHNAGKVWPKNSFIKTPGEVTMVIGQQIQTQDMSASDLNKHVFELMDDMMIEMEAGQATSSKVMGN
jgi:1-acyl-sn-glycerol-3-phosphate acyltransferase